MTDHELIANIHRRMDSQDRMLLEIRDQLNQHLAEQKIIAPAIDELVSLWKGSKLLIPIMAALSAGIWTVIVWAKDHLK